VAFNVLFGNTDDHFRNHGFLLTDKGWTLAPAYDINPSMSRSQCLLINENTEAADIGILKDSCESYMLDRKEAEDIISEASDTIRDWRNVAKANGISSRPLEAYSSRWDEV